MTVGDNTGNSVRWGIEQRLAFAANRLFWDGALRREDIMRRFGVSPTQATSDLARLRAALGPDIAYDVSKRAYVPGAGMAAPPAGAEVLLQELRLIAEDCLPAELGILSTLPQMTIAGATTRAVDTSVLRAVLSAIREGDALEANYVSFQRLGTGRRILSPHALVFDGFRWHARAHDAEDGRFKDFVLSRLSEPTAAGPAQSPASDDAEWNTMVRLTIVPHPGLGEHQKAVVMRDYGMASGRLDLTVRAAVTFYTKKRLGLIEGHANRPPFEQQIVLSEIHLSKSTKV